MLLDDIIDLATDDKQSIAVLLRKCIILASQLKNEQLKSWANKELNGYDPDDNLPPYRTLKTLAKGNFYGELRTPTQGLANSGSGFGRGASQMGYRRFISSPYWSL
jgi:hypothetical protein